jgi:hypothetical protein
LGCGPRKPLSHGREGGEQRPQRAYARPLTRCRHRLVFHPFHGSVDTGLSGGLKVADDEGPSLPGIEGLWGQGLLWALARTEQPRLHGGVYTSQPALQPFSQTRCRDPHIIRIAAAVKDMECLRTAGPALKQLSPHERPLSGVHKAGRKTHWAHRLSSAWVISLYLKRASNAGSVSK